jgi:NAD(P)-dependent dehydrogenase (short-subunit alcohol dehydrogenase family)
MGAESRLLENKTAVVYGGGGAIGGAVARSFARAGARVFLAGRTLAHLDAVADKILAEGGRSKPLASMRSTISRSTLTPMP